MSAPPRRSGWYGPGPFGGDEVLIAHGGMGHGEQPVHAVRLAEYWMSETLVTWAAYCDVMGWSAPPDGLPRDMPKERDQCFVLMEENKIRLQYCESETRQAGTTGMPMHRRCNGSNPTDAF